MGEISTPAVLALPPVTVERLAQLGRSGILVIQKFCELQEVESVCEEFGFDARRETACVLDELENAHRKTVLMLDPTIVGLLRTARNHETFVFAGNKHHTWIEAILDRPGNLLQRLGMLADLYSEDREDTWLRLLAQKKRLWLPRESPESDDPWPCPARDVIVDLESDFNRAMAMLGPGLLSGHQFTVTPEIRVIADRVVLIESAAKDDTEATVYAPTFGVRPAGITHTKPDGTIVTEGCGGVPLGLAKTKPLLVAADETSEQPEKEPRRCWKRDHHWAKEKASKGLSVGAIRDAWNALTDADRQAIDSRSWKKVPKGKPGWSIVKKGINRAAAEGDDCSEI